MNNYKETCINFLLNAFMDAVVVLPDLPTNNVRHGISACLKFASRAAIKLGIPPSELTRELQEEWMWNEADIRSKDSGSNDSGSSGVLN